MGINPELLIFFTGMLPVSELRGAIPLGLKMGVSFPQVFILAFLGNIIPVLPLLFLFKYFFHRLKGVKIVGDFLRWWFRNVERRSKIVKRWGFWGLVFFVSLPLPVTGAWTGTVAATLFELKTKRAFLAILLGVFIAGLIVSLVSSGVIKLFSIKIR